MGRNPIAKYILRRPKHATQLIQSPGHVNRIIDALPRDRAIFTGVMGGCCSVILCWQQAGREYQHMRGYHGGGGPGNIPWPQFVAGVPNNGFTLAWIAAAPADPQHLTNAQQMLVQAGLNLVTVQTMATTNLKVNRRGEGSDASATNYTTEYVVSNVGVFDI